MRQLTKHALPRTSARLAPPISPNPVYTILSFLSLFLFITIFFMSFYSVFIINNNDNIVLIFFYKKADCSAVTDYPTYFAAEHGVLNGTDAITAEVYARGYY